MNPIHIYRTIQSAAGEQAPVLKRCLRDSVIAASLQGASFALLVPICLALGAGNNRAAHPLQHLSLACARLQLPRQLRPRGRHHAPPFGRTPAPHSLANPLPPAQRRAKCAARRYHRRNLQPHPHRQQHADCCRLHPAGHRAHHPHLGLAPRPHPPHQLPAYRHHPARDAAADGACQSAACPCQCQPERRTARIQPGSAPSSKRRTAPVPACRACNKPLARSRPSSATRSSPKPCPTPCLVPPFCC